MKKIILSLALVISVGFVFSQTNTFPSSGNVGIGTNSPAEKLQIIGGKVFIGTPSIIDSYDQLYLAGSSPGFRQEVHRSSGGAAFDFMNAYAHKTGAVGDALWGKIGVLGDFGNIGVDAPPTVTYVYFGAGPNVSYLNNTFRLYPNGTAYFNDNVGIGTTAPGYQLDVARTGGANLGAWARLGSIYAVGEASGSYPSIGYNINSNSSSFKYAATDFASWIKFQAGGLQFHTAPSGTSGEAITSTQVMTVLQGGNVGIGITTPQANLDVNGTTYSRKLYVGTPDANTVTNMGTNLLAVNGTAVFVKAKVALYGTTWPDYVFSPAYKLPSLDSLEQFIKINRHLPEVPTASEVNKNGIDLGKTQTVLLKKIEELTLFIIEQKKEIEEIKSKLLSLSRENENINEKASQTSIKSNF